jgi:hypothetical protein
MMVNSDESGICASSVRFRKRYPELIQIVYGEVVKKQSEYTKLKVYVDHIVVNLQQLTHIHYSDMMAIFHRMLKGFKLLFTEFGSFIPDPRMVGFT